MGEPGRWVEDSPLLAAGTVAAQYGRGSAPGPSARDRGRIAETEGRLPLWMGRRPLCIRPRVAVRSRCIRGRGGGRCFPEGGGGPASTHTAIPIVTYDASGAERPITALWLLVGEC